jgi:IS5 family transposase
MSQMGFFNADKRLSMLSVKGDPLVSICALVPWEMFHGDIEAVVLTADEARKSNAGRKSIDALVLFRMLVLQSLYNLSDEQIEYQVRDRLSFTRFLGLGFENRIPDGTTLWLFREKLAMAGLIDKLFERFGQHLEASGYIARGGHMIDATIVPVPRQPIAGTRTSRSRPVPPPRTGRSIRRRTGRRTRTRAGRRSMGAASSATRTM